MELSSYVFLIFVFIYIYTYIHIYLDYKWWNIEKDRDYSRTLTIKYCWCPLCIKKKKICKKFYDYNLEQIKSYIGIYLRFVYELNQLI